MPNLSNCTPGNSSFVIECNLNTFIFHSMLVLTSGQGPPWMQEVYPSAIHTSWPNHLVSCMAAIVSSVSTPSSRSQFFVNCIQVTITHWWVNFANPRISRTFNQGLYIPCSQCKLVSMMGVVWTQASLSILVLVFGLPLRPKLKRKLPVTSPGLRGDRWSDLSHISVPQGSPLEGVWPAIPPHMHTHAPPSCTSFPLTYQSSVLNQAVAAVTLILLCL